VRRSWGLRSEEALVADAWQARDSVGCATEWRARQPHRDDRAFASFDAAPHASSLAAVRMRCSSAERSEGSLGLMRLLREAVSRKGYTLHEPHTPIDAMRYDTPLHSTLETGGHGSGAALDVPDSCRGRNRDAWSGFC
jgi:hypothetical protein